MDGEGCFYDRERRSFHAALLRSILTISHEGVPSNADTASRLSVAIAQGIAEELRVETHVVRGSGQTAGNRFESACADFVRSTFGQLQHLRPGTWEVTQITGRGGLQLAAYQQYAHLRELDRLSKAEASLAAVLGNDYTITPDIVIERIPEPDAAINARRALVDDSLAMHAGLRESVNRRPLLHASLSCKWTLRSDRAQNARAEALNLIRNRKGHLPHIVVITAEPLPSRIASIALGTGDIDCTYHFALRELQLAVDDRGDAKARRQLEIMVRGDRLRDISDLPLDLSV